MTDLSPEVVGRMVALVRAWANDARTVAEARQLGIEARAIVALLPEPVDPDLMEARGIAAPLLNRNSGSRAHDALLSGEADSGGIVQAALQGIKRGRELARAQASGGADHG